MTADDVVLRKSPRIAARVVDGSALIVVIDTQMLHRLDEVGTRVWELCDGKSVAELADALVEHYEVERAQALDDVREFVSELRGIGALEPEGAA